MPQPLPKYGGDHIILIGAVERYRHNELTAPALTAGATLAWAAG